MFKGKTFWKIVCEDFNNKIFFISSKLFRNFFHYQLWFFFVEVHSLHFSKSFHLSRWMYEKEEKEAKRSLGTKNKNKEKTFKTKTEHVTGFCDRRNHKTKLDVLGKSPHLSCPCFKLTRVRLPSPPTVPPTYLLPPSPLPSSPPPLSSISLFLPLCSVLLPSYPHPLPFPALHLKKLQFTYSVFQIIFYLFIVWLN